MPMIRLPASGNGHIVQSIHCWRRFSPPAGILSSQEIRKEISLLSTLDLAPNFGAFRPVREIADRP